MITLFPDQTELIARVRESFKTHRRVQMQAPTGFGKMILSAWLMQQIAAKERTAIFATHRIEILDHAVETFKKFNVPFGVISPNYPPNPFQPIQIASIMTLRSRQRRGLKLPPADLICVDESHHAVSKSWKETLAAFPKAKILGASATPQRLDNKPMREVFDDLVCGPSVEWLIKNKRLAPYKAYAPSHPDTAGLHVKMGEYVTAESEAMMDKPTLTGNMVEHYLKLARGKKFIARGVSIKHSKHIAEQFRANGVMAWHVDGETPKGERSQAMRALKNGDLQGLTYVDIFNEGVDVQDAEVFIDGRPTMSLTVCLQGWGRVLRYLPGKTALIFDHANNLAKHGLPDDERVWSLDGVDRSKKKTDASDSFTIVQCKSCYAVFRPAPVCPQCGAPTAGDGRVVKEREGELEEVDVEAMRRERNIEQARSQSVDELVELGRKRGYRSPEKWASYVWTARMAKRKSA